MLLRHGGTDGGYALYLKDNRLHYVHNYCARQYFHLESSTDVSQGKHTLRYEFEATGKADLGKGIGTPGIGQLYIDGKLVGQMDLPVTTPISLGLTGGILAGAAPGAPIGDFYEPPFEFTGTLQSVIIDVSGELIKDEAAEMRMAMARQ